MSGAGGDRHEVPPNRHHAWHRRSSGTVSGNDATVHGVAQSALFVFSHPGSEIALQRKIFALLFKWAHSYVFFLYASFSRLYVFGLRTSSLMRFTSTNLQC